LAYTFLSIFPFINILFQDTVKGAQTSIYLAVSEEVEGVSGKYFENCKVKLKLSSLLHNQLSGA
jgi:hypothetical protein